MVASGAHGSEPGNNGRRIDALREIKEAERAVREQKEEAEREAEDLRNVSETQLDEAAEAVIDRFKARVGGS